MDASLVKLSIRPLQRIFGLAGLQVSRKATAPPRPPLADQPLWIQAIIERVAPFTMTSPERLASLCQAVAYIVKGGIDGDIVECGVWKGGSMMAAALALKHLGDTNRSLYLFDTFDGMSEPTGADVEATTKETAETLLQTSRKGESVWAYSTIEEVHRNLSTAAYPDERICLVKGKVEDTIPYNFPGPIALLRLDTDWYESTRHELLHLYPLLANRGVLIIDDYGHWEGARRAVDEYMDAEHLSLLLNRIDYTGRIAIKP